MSRDTIKDKDGNEWLPFVNEFKQRKLRNVKTGDVKDDPRWNVVAGGIGVSTRDTPRVRIAPGTGSELFDWD